MLFQREGQPSGTVRFGTAFAIALVVGALGFTGGIFAGNRTYANGPLLGDSPPEGVDMTPVWKAWRIIDEKFVPAAVATTSIAAASTTDAEQRRVWGMIEGLANSLDDPYTYFMPPAEQKQFSEDMTGAFEGVGMEIAVRDEVLVIVSPLKGTPAERAGLRAGDKILKIDGDDTRGVDITSAVQRIRGPKGSTVTFSIFRDGWSEPKDVQVVRDVINVPIVTTEIKEGVFVIEVASFTANSPGLFRNALREFVDSGTSRLIIDLRGNPGGYLDAAVDMASWFLPSGKIVVVEDYAGHETNITHRSRGYNVFNDNLRMVILVDKGSASASEILALALNSHGKARLIGSPTFGKGSVQELIDITPDTGLKLTVARWLGPNGEHIPHSGIIPDIQVERTEDDIKSDKDPQIDAAIKAVNE
ncbi:MAG: Carboxy-terminal-processing protease [Parcubacteria group bacterium Gr01-1014_8]|nr:MAG: Carboxy-terminal-processing protease [Parcubacteria group bacterium Gr01-1014_8]